MAGASLFALLDDITTILDDVATMTKVATKKTAGVLGDDLALNAQQVAGVAAERELPVVWAVAVGSLRNKLILVPVALAISLLLPWAITPLLMLGGAFLCYEGVEKLAHKYLHSAEDAAHTEQLHAAVANPETDLLTLEADKIKGAIRTDFILSAEIITITLGSVAGASLGKQIAVLSGIALLMTVGVYGLVAGIVKLDDAGLHLRRRSSALAQRGGTLLLAAAPWLMRGLSVAGTLAMFMVGGGILTHGIAALHHGIAHLADFAGALAPLLAAVADAAVGIAAGGLALAAAMPLQAALRKLRY